jgi:hypothetical protein
VKFALADAIGKNGDIETYMGKAFPQYKTNGTTYLYASAVNQSTQVIKMITVKGEPVLQYTITNAKGFGDANRCSAAVLTGPRRKGKKYVWTLTPEIGKVKGKTGRRRVAARSPVGWVRGAHFPGSRVSGGSSPADGPFRFG